MATFIGIGLVVGLIAKWLHEASKKQTASQSAAQPAQGRIKAAKTTAGILKHDSALNPPKPLKYRMRGFGGGPNHTSLHPRHWNSVKSVTFVPGIGHCRTSEALPYLRRLIDAQIRDFEAQFASYEAEFEKKIEGIRGSDREWLIREFGNERRRFEESIASLRESRANLGKGRAASRGKA